MDEIEPRPQGVRAEGCGTCRLLHPGLADCPRCRGRAAFRPARMMDPDAIRREVFRAADAYAPGREALDALVDLLFLYAPVALAALEEHGRLTLDDLRRDDLAIGDRA